MPARKIEVRIPGAEPFMAAPRRKGSAARIHKSSLPAPLAKRALAVMQRRVSRTADGRFA